MSAYSHNHETCVYGILCIYTKCEHGYYEESLFILIRKTNRFFCFGFLFLFGKKAQKNDNYYKAYVSMVDDIQKALEAQLLYFQKR